MMIDVNNLEHLDALVDAVAEIDEHVANQLRRKLRQPKSVTLTTSEWRILLGHYKLNATNEQWITNLILKIEKQLESEQT